MAQNAPNFVQRMSGLVLTITGALSFLAPLITRLVIGTAFFYTGRGKLGGLDKVTSFFTDLGIPFPHANAVFISTLEFVGGICIFLGLGTRIFSFLLSCTMVVALLTSDGGEWVKKFPSDVTDVTSFTLLLFLIWLVLYGPGPISVDYILSRLLGLRRTETPTALPRANVSTMARS